MKKIITSLAVIALFSVSFVSCKKEKTKSVSERIVGVWNLKTMLYHEHVEGTDNTSTSAGGANDTFEFTADGNVKVNLNGSSDASTYTIIGEKQVSITDDETYDIKQLDEHNLVLYVKEVDGSDFAELTLTFTK